MDDDTEPCPIDPIYDLIEKMISSYYYTVVKPTPDKKIKIVEIVFTNSLPATGYVCFEDKSFECLDTVQINWLYKKYGIDDSRIQKFVEDHILFKSITKLQTINALLPLYDEY